MKDAAMTASEGVQPMDLSAPERIWLQIDTGGNSEDRSQPIQRESWADLTWCYDSLGGQEVGYVRADLATDHAAEVAALREALREIRDSTFRSAITLRGIADRALSA